MLNGINFLSSWSHRGWRCKEKVMVRKNAWCGLDAFTSIDSASYLWSSPVCSRSSLVFQLLFVWLCLLMDVRVCLWYFYLFYSGCHYTIDSGCSELAYCHTASTISAVRMQKIHRRLMHLRLESVHCPTMQWAWHFKYDEGPAFDVSFLKHYLDLIITGLQKVFLH